MRRFVWDQPWDDFGRRRYVAAIGLTVRVDRDDVDGFVVSPVSPAALAAYCGVGDTEREAINDLIAALNTLRDGLDARRSGLSDRMRAVLRELNSRLAWRTSVSSASQRVSTLRSVAGRRWTLTNEPGPKA